MLDIQPTVGAETFSLRNGYCYVKFWIDKRQINTFTLGTIACYDTILPLTKTYLAENAFSASTHVKTKAKNRLLYHNDFRLAFTNFDQDIKSLCQNSQSLGQAAQPEPESSRPVKILGPKSLQNFYVKSPAEILEVLVNSNVYSFHITQCNTTKSV